MTSFLPESDSEDELPPAWEERATVDGSVYYVNHSTEATQWAHPRTGKKKIVTGDLPDGWERKVEADGKVVYIDKKHGSSTHTDPRLVFAKEVKEHLMDVRQTFDGSSTALNVLNGHDLSSKVVFITGGTSGIGFETARSLALHGAEVLISGSSAATCQAAVDKIQKEKPTARVAAQPINLASLSSVRSAAAQICLRYPKLDVIILNAGIFCVGWDQTEDGLESVFQVNHLSHFYLVMLLESTLRRGSRVIIVSSESHRQSNLSEKNFSLEKLSPSSSSGYWDVMAYNHSKLCNVLHAVELSKRLQYITDVTVFSLHPGNLINTGITRKSCFFRFLFAFVRPFTKSLQQGAATTVFCAVSPDLSGFNGAYFNNCWLTESSKSGQNHRLATMLWDLSEELLREKGFTFPNSPLANALIH